MPRKDRSFFLVVSSVVILLNLIPFWCAFQAGGNQYIFDGVLLNPLDGHTYLAKMYQGFRGDWRFTLPYTPNPGRGAYINMIYVFLGHVARWISFSLPITFSVSRILGGIFLLVVLHRFYDATVQETRSRRVAFTFSALGSGMGWLLIPAGVFTADFWVAEAYPFLSIYDNVHFPIGLALILLLLMPHPTNSESESWGQKGWQFVILALLLGLISPFGVVITLVVLSGYLFAVEFKQFYSMNWVKFLRNPLLKRILWIVLGGAPILIYQLWAIRSDPILLGWDAQNLTLTPPWWDVLTSFSPAILFALFAVRKAKLGSPALLFLVWVILGFILIVIPFGLQRRFMMGLYIPLAGLAALGLEQISLGKRSRQRVLTIMLFILSVPTNLIVILAGQSGIRSYDPILYHTKDESLGIQWLETKTPRDALVLASPGMGLIIPAFSGRQVIYGHPFETVNAKVEEQAVLGFFHLTESEAAHFLTTRGVDYIFYGPRERMLGDLPLTEGLELTFEEGNVQIYAVEK